MIITSSRPGYKLPYCTFIHDENSRSLKALRNVLNWPLHLLFVLFSMLSVPQIITTPIFLLSFPLFPLSLHCRLFPYLSVWLSLTLSLIPCLLHKRSCWASCWEACPDMNHAAELTHHDGERERERPQSVWLCASGRHVFLFVHLVNSCAHTHRCVCGYIGAF